MRGERPSAVHRPAVVPHDEIADAPAVAVHELRLRGEREQVEQQDAALRERPADDVRGVGADVERLASRRRMRADERLRHGRDLGALRLGELGVARQPARVREVVHGDEPVETARLLSNAGEGYLPQPQPAIERALTHYDHDEYAASGAVRHPDWGNGRIGFQPFPFPSYTEELVRRLADTAVEGDRLYETRQAAAKAPIRDDQLRAGPVYLQASLAYSLEWNDNIYYTPTNTEDDFIHRPQLNLGATWPVSDDSRLTFGVGLGYQHYMDHSDLDRMILTPDSELAWDIKIKDLVLTLYDRAEYSQDVVSQGGLSGTAEFPRIENTAGTRARW